MTDNRTTELLREFTENAIYCNRFGSLYADEERIAEYAERIEQAIAATLGEQIVRCRDCKHATISTMGVCKYCEMFVLPDEDGYGADPQVMLPLDFFCGYGEPRGDAE